MLIKNSLEPEAFVTGTLNFKWSFITQLCIGILPLAVEVGCYYCTSPEFSLMANFHLYLVSASVWHI